MKPSAGKPHWINKKIDFRAMHAIEEKLSGLQIHTVCRQAKCPNISECFKRGTATFILLGVKCTRECAFCSVTRGIPERVKEDEPDMVLEAVRRMGLGYVVITSVTRDDLADGGASIFAETVKKIKSRSPEIKVEVLTPDFMGRMEAIGAVLAAKPDVFGHNIETVPSLYKIRKGADYTRSLGVLGTSKKLSPGVFTKSAIMLGLGETEQEVESVLADLAKVKCDFLSIGQYLQPGRDNYPVKEYIRPEKFDDYKKLALRMGFLHVESGTYVRSSYMADNYAAAL